MATYQGIKGRTVQNLASDPPAALGLGQVWYNTTGGTLKTSVAVGAWASGTTLPTPGARYNVPGFGILTAGALVGGYGGTPTRTSETTEYDGTTWTVGGAMVQQASDNAANGPLTGAFTAGGYTGSPTNTSGTYDGTSWTAQGTISGGPQFPQNQSAGTSTAGLIFGGPDAGNTTTEEFDGATWTTVNNLPANRGAGAGGGTQTDAFGIAGGYPTIQTAGVLYDGTSWTAGNSCNTARNRGGGSAGGGTAASPVGFFCGGNVPAATGAAEEFDGTSWASMPSLATARASNGVFGTKTAGVCAGGSPTPSNVEEFILADTVQTITSTT
jgi:hypothetical protein